MKQFLFNIIVLINLFSCSNMELTKTDSYGTTSFGNINKELVIENDIELSKRIEFLKYNLNNLRYDYIAELNYLRNCEIEISSMKKLNNDLVVVRIANKFNLSSFDKKYGKISNEFYVRFSKNSLSLEQELSNLNEIIEDEIDNLKNKRIECSLRVQHLKSQSDEKVEQVSIENKPKKIYKNTYVNLHEEL